MIPEANEGLNETFNERYTDAQTKLKLKIPQLTLAVVDPGLS